MAEHDETQRIDPVEPTRVLDTEPTARLDPSPAAPPQPAKPPYTPQYGVSPEPSGSHDSTPYSAGQPSLAPPGDASWQPPVPGPGSTPANWAAQQPPWPGAYPPAPPGYAIPQQTAAYGQSYPYPGYPPAGYPPPPGYPGWGVPEQSPYPQYDTSAGPYARYANPGSGGQPPPPYNPYAPYYAGQPWSPPVAAPPKPPRRVGRTILVVTLALALAVTGFAWVLRPLLEQSTAPPVPTVEPARPSQPATQPGEDPDPNPRPGGTGTASESAGIVFISGESSGGIASGTGMVLTPDGKVLTNYHVVAGTQSLMVTIADTDDTYPATVLGFDQSKDVALLQLADASGLETIAIDEDEVKVGDPVAAVGNAGGNHQLVRAEGEVVRLDRSLTVNSDSPWGAQENLSGVIETTAGAVPGHSGGPMFDDEAEVLGMTTAGSTEAGRSYAVPIADALEVVSIIEAGKDVGTVRVGPAGYLGIVIGEATREGVIITDVLPESPADQAGIEVGSTLTRIGDTLVVETTNLATVIRGLEPGDEVMIEWLTPRGEERRASVILTASPVN